MKTQNNNEVFSFEEYKKTFLPIENKENIFRVENPSELGNRLADKALEAIKEILLSTLHTPSSPPKEQ